MPSGTAFKEQLLKVRREVQLSSDSKSLLRSLKETQRCLEGLANEPNYTLCVAHLVKELLDWVAIKEDRELDPVPASKACLGLLEEYLNVCHQVESTTRCFLVVRLYNAFVALNRKDTCCRTKLYIARLMHQFPIADDQVDLFVRVKRIVLKTAQEAKETADIMEEGADLVIEMQRKLLVHEANRAPTADGIRESALALFREVFDKGMAILCRLYPVTRTKAEQLYQTIMDTMLTVVKPSEPELISLLGDSVGFVETILANASGESVNYCQFAGFLALFKDIRSEPYASCYRLISMLVELVKQQTPTDVQIESITKRVRAVHTTFPSHQLVVRVAIFLTCQAIPYLYRLPQELSLTVSHAAIGLCEALMHFVRQCPSDTVPELCRLCTSSRRHLADKLLSILMHLSIVQARNAAERRNEQSKLSYSLGRGCELIKRKLALLEELGCERKQSLIDTTMRYSISWLKYALTLLRDDSQATADEVDEIVLTLKTLVSVQNRYRFEFLSDLHLVRLLENAYADRPSGTNGVSTSWWPNVSIRLLKLLITLREPTSSNEEHTATISSIVRSIMCYQINAPETDPIRSLTLLQLYDHPSYDRHGFTFDSYPSRAEKFTILAEEMALVTKYKTSNTLPVWEYMRELTKVGEIGENCLAFGMALHGFSESDAGKLPESMMDTLLGALSLYKPTNTLERIKLSAAQAIVSYHTFSLESRSVLNRLREIPFKLDHMRCGQIDEIMLENRIDREAQLKQRMEVIRKNYRELLVMLAEDKFRSLWVLPSIAQISSILDNIARLYHLNYHPHRAVELQLLNLLLVAQRHDARPLDQCSPLGFLLEQHQLAKLQLRQLHEKIPAKHAGDVLASLEGLANRAKALLHAPGTSLDDVPENRKFQLLNLYLGLAVYNASRADLEQALRLILNALDLLDRSNNVGTIAQLFQGRAAQIIFRLATEYDLPWPDAVPPLAFMKRMLTSFNALQKLPTEHMFTLSLATVDMTVAVLQYLIVRYDTGPLIEPHVEQLLKFVLRRGAGLRVMQLLLLYGQMCADMEKLDRCEIALSYLDRLLMFRPIRSQDEKENGQLGDELSLAGSYKSIQHHKTINSNLSVTSSANTEELVDVEREAAPKHRIIPPNITLDETTVKETIIQHYLMFCHSPGCDCRYCSYPQYKLMAYQTAALAVRLSLMQHSKTRKHIERSYQSLIEHWEKLYPKLASWAVPVYLSDLSVAVMRTHLNYGQFLIRRERFDRARQVYEWATEITEVITIDPALSADLQYNLKALEFLVRQRTATPIPKRSRSMIEARYAELLARKSKTNGDNTPDGMGQLTTNLSNLTMKTPKPASRTCAPPKTVDRVNELLRQAATRRHQLKTNGATDPALGISEGIISNRIYSSQSARKPKTVNIFVDSPPGRNRKVVTIPATVAKMQKPADKASITTTSAVIKSKGKDTYDFEGSEESKDREKNNRRGGKRTLMNESTIPNHNADSYRDALVKETPVCTPPTTRPDASANITARKVRRLVVEEFPSLSESSDTDTSTKTPHTHKRTDSPAPLNGSFRDALVLGGTVAKKDDSSVVIVLDDSNDSSHKSEEAIEASFVQSNAVSADKLAGLSLKSYSDRKRLLDSAGRPLSGSAVRPVATKRRTPLLAAKTKLRFDEPSPEQIDDDGAKHFHAHIKQDGNEKALKKPTEGKPSRSHMKKANEPVAIPVPSNTSVESSGQSNVESRISCIATRTRLRRKRI